MLDEFDKIFENVWRVWRWKVLKQCTIKKGISNISLVVLRKHMQYFTREKF